MNIFAIIKAVGVVCYLLHRGGWIKVCDVERQAADGTSVQTTAWGCPKCQKSWEVPRS